MEKEATWKKLKLRETCNCIRKSRLYLLSAVLFTVVIWSKQSLNHSYLEKIPYRESRSLDSVYLDIPHFILIMCDDSSSGNRKNIKNDIKRQISQANVMIKSAIALSSGPLRFSVVSDSSKVYEDLLLSMRRWPRNFKSRLLVEHKPVWYPDEHKSMRNMFRPCATARLFLTESFQEVDSAIFIDTDFIFMSPPQVIWNEFSHFDSKQVAALAPCLFHYDNPSIKKVPFYGETGLNGGVMLMNFTRMKDFPGGGWIAENLKAFEDYKDDIVLADQDIMNILFSRYPERVHELSCKFNFRPLQCSKDKNKCPVTQHEGASLIHGNAMAFYGREKHFEAIYKSWTNHKLGSSIHSLLTSMKNRLRKVSDDGKSRCNKLKDIAEVLTLSLQNFVELIN